MKMLQSFSLALIVIFGVSLNQAVDVSFNTIDNSAAPMYDCYICYNSKSEQMITRYINFHKN